MNTPAINFVEPAGSKFKLGALLITADAMDELDAKALEPLPFLFKHAQGDWGDVCEEDRLANDFALTNEERIVSFYNIGEEKLCIITEYDRSATTLMLLSEY